MSQKITRPSQTTSITTTTIKKNRATNIWNRVKSQTLTPPPKSNNPDLIDSVNPQSIGIRIRIPPQTYQHSIGAKTDHLNRPIHQSSKQPRDPLGSGRGYDRTTRPTTNQSRDGGTHHPSLHESKLRNTELIWGGQGGGHLGWRRARRTECEATGERRGRRRGKPER